MRGYLERVRRLSNKAAAPLTGILIALLLIAVPASAGIKSAGGFKYVSKAFELPRSTSQDGKFKRYKAKCPRGTSVVGGGERNDSSFDQVRMAQTYPIDDGDKNKKPEDGWGVLLQNVADAKHQGDVFAICGKARAVYVSENLDVAGGNQDQDDINCPEGLSTSMGGIRGHRLLFQNAGAPIGSEYFSYYADNYDSVTRTVKGTAICVPYETQYASFQGADTVPARSRSLREAECPAGTHVIGGGQSNSGVFDFYASSQFPSAPSGPPDRYWSVVVENLDESFDHLSDVVATCAPTQ